MAYSRDYVEEQLEITKTLLGEQMSKLNEDNLRESIQSEYTDEELSKLNNAVVTVSSNGDNTCSLRCKGTLLISCPYSRILQYREVFDQYVLDEADTVEEAIDIFRRDYPPNKNIAMGTAKGRIRSQFNQLKEDADKHDVDLTEFFD